MKVVLLGSFLLLLNIAYSQVGIGTDTPNPHSILDIRSGSAGLLIPRMDSVARKLIPDTKGLLVYDTTTHSLWHNTGSDWENYFTIPQGTSVGNMLYWDGSKWVIIPPGLPDQVLTINASNIPEWRSNIYNPPGLYINDNSFSEGTTPTNTVRQFLVRLVNPSNQEISVQYTIVNGTAFFPSDYVATSSGTLVFPIGQTSTSITVTIIGDTNIEADETFFINLSNPVNTIISDNQARITIINDD